VPKPTAAAANDGAAVLFRRGVVYATGYGRLSGSAVRTRLLAARPLVRGRYTLALTSQRGRRVTTIRRVVAVS